MYLIHEIADREHCSVSFAKDRPSAMAAANILLKQHCTDSGHLEAYEDLEQHPVPNRWPQDMSLAGDGDDKEPTGAWCNLKAGLLNSWDAHVTALSRAEMSQALDILLKELCRDTMAKPGSGCGDGPCGDCAVSLCLELMQGTWADKNEKPDDPDPEESED